jgi:hypothetical protein
MITDITHLFLDGNNMLFVPASLRSLMISRSKHKAEQILHAYAIKFAKLANIPNVTLVFDHSSGADKQESVVNALGGNVLVGVISANRAGFSTSDDALVHWLGELKKQV